MLAPPCLSGAQNDSIRNDSTIQLHEVEVRSAKIISRPDGLLYLPSARQKESSASGYGLLSQLSMPNMLIDEAKRSIAAADGRGVQVRINGALASVADMLSLETGLVRSVELINNPGLRYGSGTGYVINIRTRRADTGHSVGLNLTNAATYRYGHDMVFAQWNRRKSELSLSYDFGYSDLRHTRLSEKADYLLNDGSHYNIVRRDSLRRDRSFSNDIQLKYNLADSATYVFQATFSASFQHSPTNRTVRLFAETGHNATPILLLDRSKQLSPVLDLYFFRAIGSHQSLTANVVGTAISSEQYSLNSEGGNYSYSVDGNTWSLTSEAIYENKLRPLTFALGFNHQWKYTRNVYSGSVASTNNMHNSNLYLFSQISGSLMASRLSYSAGIGLSNVLYRQAESHYSYWLFRPKATLTYRFSPQLSLMYSFEVAQHISQIAMISNTQVRNNSMEWTVGNPNIEPNSVITHGLRLAYSRPRLYSQIYTEWRNNRNCNMASYERTADNQFLYSQKNQPHVNMFYISSYTSWNAVADRLTLSLSGGLFRYFNKGSDYSHCLTTCNVSGAIRAYLGRFTLTAQADNGWEFMEGENRSRQGLSNSVQLGYRLGQCWLAVTWYHPFESNPKQFRSRLLSRYIRKDITMRSADEGNSIMLSLSWKLSRGRKYNDIKRTMNNHDTQTGIL